MAAPAVRWLTIRRSTTTSASASAVSTSPPPSDQSYEWFVPNCSWITGESASSACSGSTTTGSDAYSTKTSSAASTTAYLSSPTTTATGSPTWQTLPRASGQWSGVLTSTPGGTQAIGSGAARSVMSSPVSTSLTPLRPSSADLSIETMLACASVERTIAA